MTLLEFKNSQLANFYRHGHFENEEGKGSVFKKMLNLSLFFYAVSQLDSETLFFKKKIEAVLQCP